MTTLPYLDPILSCAKSAALEAVLLKDEVSEWEAMKRAGAGIARQFVKDYEELRAVPQHLRVLALVGKGHNGGDTLLACGQLLADYPRAKMTVLLACGKDSLRPLARRAYDELADRVDVHLIPEEADEAGLLQLLKTVSAGCAYHACFDGLLGMSFTPPHRDPYAAIIGAVNQFADIDLRVAVDVPSGRGDVSDSLCFIADFTYATGIAKKVLFESPGDCGRIRFVDLGFFPSVSEQVEEADEFLINKKVLDPFRKLRPSVAEKRAFGHLFIVAGSSEMPGALLMAVEAALRSGVGNVTAFAPSSMAGYFASKIPEAIWLGWPESSSGTLSSRALPMLFERLGQATALLMGPGMGHDKHTDLIIQEIVQRAELPLILDADALRQRAVDVVSRRKSSAGPVIVTPHMGEYMRMAKLSAPDFSNNMLKHFCNKYRLITVLKGPQTRISDGKSVFLSSFGGPVLSRGGSGDVLAGLISGMVAQNDCVAVESCAQGVALHGLAADLLARKKGQTFVHTTELLDYFSEVQRDVVD